MQINTIMKYHYTPTRMARIKKKKRKQCQVLLRMRMQSIWNFHIFLVEEQNGTATLEKTISN